MSACVRAKHLTSLSSTTTSVGVTEAPMAATRRTVSGRPITRLKTPNASTPIGARAMRLDRCVAQIRTHVSVSFTHASPDDSTPAAPELFIGDDFASLIVVVVAAYRSRASWLSIVCQATVP